MGHVWDIAGYVWKADTYCVDCARPGVDSAREAGVDLEDEYSYDSDDYPKVILEGEEGLAFCCWCGVLLDTSWGPYEVEAAAGMLVEASLALRAGEPRAVMVLDDVAEHLSWCVVDAREEQAQRIYALARRLYPVPA